MSFRLKVVLAAITSLAVSGSLLHATSLLLNPGFEADPQGQTSALLGWNTYTGGSGNVWSETSSTYAHSGTNYLKVYQAFNSTVNYNGVYQDNLSGPGAVYSADAWAYTLSSDALAGQNVAWIEVTFRDAAANVLALYRSTLINTNVIAKGLFPKSTWQHLYITNQYNPTTYVITNTTSQLVAPAGTSFVRYQVMFQGDANNSGGSVYFDDLDLVQTAGQPQGNWNIVWSDEFSGTTINTKNWNFDTGNNNGWGNGELEDYTTSSQNAYVSGGYLNIVALNPSTNTYTSARVNSSGLFSPLYGRVSWRAKIPAGQGLWPALWMYPQSSVYGGWAASGEIDVMETIGSNPTNIFGTLHFGGPYPDNTQSSGPSFNFLPGTSVTNFNIYTVEWATNAINWYINGLLYETQTSWWSSSNTGNTELNPYPAPFNEPFFLIMNLAVGGTLGGTPVSSTFPADMQIDYVRYYNVTSPLQITVTPEPGANEMILTWPTNVVCHLEYATSVNGPWTSILSATSPYTAHTTATSFFYRLQSP